MTPPKKPGGWFSMHPHHLQTVIIVAALMGNGQLTSASMQSAVEDTGTQIREDLAELRTDVRDHERRIAAIERGP